MISWLRAGLSWLLLAVLAGTPALVAVCLASCAEVPSAAVACHEVAERPAPSIASATADPCGTHDRAAAELAARLKPLRDGIEEPSATTPLASSASPHHVVLLVRAVTTRPAPPGPSRPPLVLRV